VWVRAALVLARALAAVRVRAVLVLARAAQVSAEARAVPAVSVPAEANRAQVPGLELPPAPARAAGQAREQAALAQLKGRRRSPTTNCPAFEMSLSSS
jgi:hypothetical protein